MADEFETFWNKDTDATKVPDSHGGFHREYRLKMPEGKQFLTHAEVVERVQTIRRFFNHHRPGKHELSVAVRDRTIGQWRAGKFTSTSSEEIYVWSPDDYDKEAGKPKPKPKPKDKDKAKAPDLAEELEATAIVIYFRHST